MSHIAYLILGSNLGDREEFLKRATELINLRVGKILNSSSIYETEPWEGINLKSQSSKLNLAQRSHELKTDKFFVSKSQFYLNQVLKILTDFTPHELLSKLSDIEKGLGRERETAISYQLSAIYKPRTIDTDILFYDDIIINTTQSSPGSQLIIPHPLLHKRKFVLVPLCEIASDFIHPVMKVSMKQLLEECDDENKVTPYFLLY